MKKEMIFVSLIFLSTTNIDAQFYCYKNGNIKQVLTSKEIYFHNDSLNNWSVDSLRDGLFNRESLIDSIDSISIVPSKKEPELMDASTLLDLSQWDMIWYEEFDEPDSLLEKTWISQNSDVNKTIACGRWRENCLICEGTLRLMNRGPKTGYPSPYTSGSVWTRKKFQYGYLECRYRYANANATNNSFWLMSIDDYPHFEIDINEGHVPHEVTTNIHNHQKDGTTTSNGAIHDVSKSVAYTYIIKDANVPITTKKIRFSAVNGGTKFHIPEFRIYNVNAAGYPKPESTTADRDVKGLINYARTAAITCSGFYSTSSVSYPVSKIADGSISSSNHWVSQENGDKWVEFEWKDPVDIGCIQFLNGWQNGSSWYNLLSDFKIEYYTGSAWKVIKSYAAQNMDLAKEYHTYGLVWNEDSLIWYFDRKEIRRTANTVCKKPSPIWLSEAIMPKLNPVANEIIGTQMEVDYVRVYQKK